MQQTLLQLCTSGEGYFFSRNYLGNGIVCIAPKYGNFQMNFQDIWAKFLFIFTQHKPKLVLFTQLAGNDWPCLSHKKGHSTDLLAKADLYTKLRDTISLWSFFSLLSSCEKTQFSGRRAGKCSLPDVEHWVLTQQRSKVPAQRREKDFPTRFCLRVLDLLRVSVGKVAGKLLHEKEVGKEITNLKWLGGFFGTMKQNCADLKRVIFSPACIALSKR